ncbi:hypothetical protein GCM10023192_56110 [Amycolatopsis samaneae]
MGPHRNTNEPRRDYPATIPLPRQMAADDADCLSKKISAKPDWCYSQNRQSGSDRRFSGHIAHIHDAESERLRHRLTAVVRELLRWADQHSCADSSEDNTA